VRGHIPSNWLFAVAVGSALFVLWERRLEKRGGQPLVTPSLLRIRSYLVGTMIAATFYAGFTGIFLVLTIFLQQGLRYTALQAALSTWIFTVASPAAPSSAVELCTSGPAGCRARHGPRDGRTLAVALVCPCGTAPTWPGPGRALLVAGCARHGHLGEPDPPPSGR